MISPLADTTATSKRQQHGLPTTGGPATVVREEQTHSCRFFIAQGCCRPKKIEEENENRKRKLLSRNMHISALTLGLGVILVIIVVPIYVDNSETQKDIQETLVSAL
jgi:hypothetical protein